jgi:hypothetical protein
MGEYKRSQNIHFCRNMEGKKEAILQALVMAGGSIPAPPHTLYNPD